METKGEKRVLFRTSTCRVEHWCDKTMSVMREQQLEACQDRLSRCPAAGIFTTDPVLLEKAARGLQKMNLAFPIVGFQMVTTNLFQCLGMVKKSVFLSLSRQLLFLLPCIYILPPLLESENGVWYSFPISDSISAFLTALLAVGLLRKLGRLKDGDEPTILGSQI